MQHSKNFFGHESEEYMSDDRSQDWTSPAHELYGPEIPTIGEELQTFTERYAYLNSTRANCVRELQAGRLSSAVFEYINSQEDILMEHVSELSNRRYKELDLVERLDFLTLEESLFKDGRGLVRMLELLHDNVAKVSDIPTLQESYLNRLMELDGQERPKSIIATFETARGTDQLESSFDLAEGLVAKALFQEGRAGEAKILLDIHEKSAQFGQRKVNVINCLETARLSTDESVYRTALSAAEKFGTYYEGSTHDRYEVLADVIATAVDFDDTLIIDKTLNELERTAEETKTPIYSLRSLIGGRSNLKHHPALAPAFELSKRFDPEYTASSVVTEDSSYSIAYDTAYRLFRMTDSGRVKQSDFEKVYAYAEEVASDYPYAQSYREMFANRSYSEEVSFLFEELDELPGGALDHDKEWVAAKRVDLSWAKSTKEEWLAAVRTYELQHPGHLHTISSQIGAALLNGYGLRQQLERAKHLVENDADIPTSNISTFSRASAYYATCQALAATGKENSELMTRALAKLEQYPKLILGLLAEDTPPHDEDLKSHVEKLDTDLESVLPAGSKLLSAIQGSDKALTIE